MRKCRDEKVVLEKFRVFCDDRTRNLVVVFDSPFVVNTCVRIVDDLKDRLKVRDPFFVKPKAYIFRDDGLDSVFQRLFLFFFGLCKHNAWIRSSCDELV